MRDFNDDYYKKIESLDREALVRLTEKVDSSPWRQGYHTQPVTGYMSSPAAFFYRDGRYHLFYNWHPLTGQNNINYWYHVSADNLSDFHNEGVKLRPDDLYDSHGLTAGSAVEIGSELFVFYTGLFEKAGKEIAPVQLAAEFKTDKKLYKHPVPLIEEMPEGIKTVRDPFVFKQRDTYYMMLGIEKADGYGGAALYQSTDGFRFEYSGVLDTPLTTFGDMWERPEVFELDGFDVLMFCPKGIDKYGYNFWNTDQAGFVIGELDTGNVSMDHGTFFEFDYGFDFNMPMTTVDACGRRVMIGLLGMHDTDYPTAVYDWANCLSVPRVLSIEDYKLKQRPHPDIKKLRQSEIKAEGYFDHHPKRLRDFYGDRYEFIINFIENDASEVYIKLRVSKREETLITYKKEQNEMILDTTFSGEMPGGVDGTRRHLKLKNNLRQLHVFVDDSSIEIFINDGDRVMSSRIFPDNSSNGVELSTEIGQCYVEMTQYKLKESRHEKIIYSWRGTD